MSDALLPLQAPVVTRKTLEAYHANVLSFEASELEAEKRMGRRGWLCAAGLGGVSCVLGASLYGAASENRKLAKGWEVRPVLVDKSTGESFQIRRAEALPDGAVEAHTKHMTWQYVMAREGYSRAEDIHRFNVVVAMSDVGEQKRFKTWWEDDKTGPRQELGPNGRATVATRANPELRRDDPKDTKGPYTHAVYHMARTVERQYHETTTVRIRATLFFGWDEGARRSDELLINPFGFAVHRYIRSWENA